MDEFWSSITVDQSLGDGFCFSIMLESSICVDPVLGFGTDENELNVDSLTNVFTVFREQVIVYDDVDYCRSGKL